MAMTQELVQELGEQGTGQAWEKVDEQAQCPPRLNEGDMVISLFLPGRGRGHSIENRLGNVMIANKDWPRQNPGRSTPSSSPFQPLAFT